MYSFNEKNKKINKMKKYADFGRRLGKFACNLMMNITKMGKKLKPEKCIFFAKIWTKK